MIATPILNKSALRSPHSAMPGAVQFLAAVVTLAKYNRLMK